MAVTWTSGQPGPAAIPSRRQGAGRDAQRARARHGHARPHIRLVVDRVVLYGIAPADRHRAGEALAHGLGELVEAWGVPAGLSGAAFPPSLPAAMDLIVTDSAAGMGAKLAVAVYQALESVGAAPAGGRR